MDTRPIAALALCAGLTTASPALGAFAAEGLFCTLGAGASVLARCEGTFGESGEAIVITLEGTPPDHVRRILLRRGDAARPFQILEVDARPIIDPETVGIVFTDMNFDGHRDLAIMEFLPAGANVPYRHFLYRAATGRFAPSPALDRIVSPAFDRRSERVRSAWRDNAARHGVDVWAWRDGELMLESRTVDTIDGDGACVRAVFEPRDGVLQQVWRTACRTP